MKILSFLELRCSIANHLLIFLYLFQVFTAEVEHVLCQDAYLLLYAKQGTPWFSNLFEMENPCSNPYISNSSPKSVLDNKDQASTSYNHVPNPSARGPHETSQSSADNSTYNPAETKTEDNVDVAPGFDIRDEVPSNDAQAPTDGVFSHDEMPGVPSSRQDDGGDLHIDEAKLDDGFRPLTPPRSPSPDVCSAKPEGKTRNAIYIHIMSAYLSIF